MKRQAGFSVIELLIVVAIILVLLAVVIPALERSRIAANEASAVGSLQAITTAQITYATSYPDMGYAKTLSNLGGSAATCATANGASSSTSCLVDSVLSSGTKSGYKFELIPEGDLAMPISAYNSVATPQAIGETGEHTFSSDQSGMIQSDLAEGDTAVAAKAVRRRKSVGVHAPAAKSSKKAWVFISRK